MTRLGRALAPLLVVPVLAVAGFAYLDVSLPRPTAADRTAVRVLRRLETTLGGPSTLSIGGEELTAACRRLSRSRRVIRLSDGTALYVSGTRVVARAVRGRRLAQFEPGFLAAAADLAGSHFLYVAELAGSIERGRDVVLGETSVRGRPAYRIRLGRERPAVELLVDEASLAPLGARYRSASLSGHAVLSPALPRPRAGHGSLRGPGC